jgi:hypothetical protein
LGAAVITGGDALKFGAHHLSLGADQDHLFIRLAHLANGDHWPRLAPLERDEADTLGAAMLAAEGLDWDALPEASLSKDEEVGARLNDGGGNHKVAHTCKSNTNHAASGASHRPRLLLVEAADATLSRCEHDVIFTRRWDHLRKLITLIKRDRNNS